MSMAIKRFVANKMKDIQSGISLKKFSHFRIVTIHYRCSSSYRLCIKIGKAR
jgi:hypothetical protein